MKTRRTRRVSVVVLSAMAAVCYPAQQVPTFRVESRLVLVDVTVHDDQGRPVDDLQMSDFTVLEDDVPQKIVSFALEKIPAAVPEAAPAEPAAAKPKAPAINLTATPLSERTKPLLRDKRLVVLFFDLSSLQPEDLIRATDSARKYLLERVTEHDLLALATYDYSLNLVQDLTNDRDVLLRRIDGLVSNEGESTAEDLGDTDTSEEVFVPDDVQFNIFNTDRRLSALETLSKLYADLPERKSLIYFSSGFQTTGSENDSQIRSTVDAANASNLTVYTVDCRGLVALPPGGGATQRSAGGRAMFSGDAVGRQRQSLSDSQETLSTLAHDTGGATFQDTNDIGTVFQKVWGDSQVYYVLGYYSSNTREDGKFRRLRVLVTRKDLRIHHRPGYFAAKQFSRMSQNERDRQLEEALNVDRPFTEVPFILQTDYFRQDGRTCQVPLSVQLAGQGLEFEEKGDKRQAQFEFLARVTDSRGSVAGVSRDVVRVQLPAPTASRIQTGQILYTTQFQLRPGEYRLKVLIRDNGTGRIGSFEQEMPVPAVDAKKLSTSSIVLGSRLVAADKGAAGVEHRGPAGPMPMMRERNETRDALMIGDRRIVPSIGNVFLRRQNLFVYFQVYGAGREADAGRPHLQTSLMLLKERKKIFESKPQTMEEWAKGERDVAAVSLSIPLRTIPQGKYVLQLHVRDVVSDTNLFRRIPLAVE